MYSETKTGVPAALRRETITANGCSNAPPTGSRMIARHLMVGVGTCKQWNGIAWQEKAGSFLRPGFAQTGDHPGGNARDDCSIKIERLSCVKNRRRGRF
jgi:hypothetical protein